MDTDSTGNGDGNSSTAPRDDLQRESSNPGVNQNGRASKQKKRNAAQMTQLDESGEAKLKPPAPTFKARFDLEKLNQRQLVELVLAHQAHWDPKQAQYVESNRRRTHNARDLDWEKYSVRHVAFKVAYLGWDFLGLAAQPDTSNTIEGCLAEAFMKVKLIKSYESCHWSRAGRTDKGVSALGQVIACHVRSNVKSGVGIVRVGTEVKEDAEEFDFVNMLNGSLPDEIRVLGWTPVPLEFDARFSAISRTYKYFFAKGDLDIEAMREAMTYLIGEHDFRNFCKMDTANVSHFTRSIFHATLAPVAPYPTYDHNISHPIGDIAEPTSQHWNTLYEFTISGSAFLWHQVRYMVAVLFMVGQKQEKPTIVKELLDTRKYPQKPLFNMASEVPLILYDVGYFTIEFKIDAGAQRRLYQHWMQYWAERAIKAQMARLILTHMDQSEVTLQYAPVESQSSSSSSALNTTSCGASSSTYLVPGESLSPDIIPTLIAPPNAYSKDGKKIPRRETKTLHWKANAARPGSIPWVLIKDQVMDVFHPKLFHLPLIERAQEESFEDRAAKRPYKKPKYGEEPEGGSNAMDSNGDE